MWYCMWYIILSKASMSMCIATAKMCCRSRRNTTVVQARRPQRCAYTRREGRTRTPHAFDTWRRYGARQRGGGQPGYYEPLFYYWFFLLLPVSTISWDILLILPVVHIMVLIMFVMGCICNLVGHIFAYSFGLTYWIIRTQFAVMAVIWPGSKDVSWKTDTASVDPTMENPILE